MSVFTQDRFRMKLHAKYVSFAYDGSKIRTIICPGESMPFVFGFKYKAMHKIKIFQIFPLYVRINISWI